MLAKGVGLTGWKVEILCLALDKWPAGLPGHACLRDEWMAPPLRGEGCPTVLPLSSSGAIFLCLLHPPLTVQLRLEIWRPLSWKLL